MSTQRQTIHSIHNKKFWTEFFYLYESLPELWDVNNPMYKNRQVKCDAYDIMVEKLRDIEPNADREDVLRKINIFRTNFRRECSRINISLKEGRHYQSTLWYFDLLCFLQTPDTKRDRKRKLGDDGEKSIMRKRRPDVQKCNDQFIIATKKEQLIEYQTHSRNEFEYELDEQPDFDYVPEDLAQALVENKHKTNNTVTEQTHSALNSYQSVQGDDEDDENDQSQQMYHHEEYQNYAIQRNVQSNSKQIKLTVDNVGHLDCEINPSGTAIDVDSIGEEQQRFHEYTTDNDNDILKPAEWCIKTSNSPNMSTLQLEKTGIHVSDINNASAFSTNDNVAAKYVRDVKTMTSSSSCGSGCNKLSESSDILAKSWAIQYDELSREQKVLARKAINDILFEGCMGHLTVGPNGRVSFNGADYKKRRVSKTSSNEEVESSEVYEQPTISASSAASSSTSAIHLANMVSVPKVHTTDEWLKL